MLINNTTIPEIIAPEKDIAGVQSILGSNFTPASLVLQSKGIYGAVRVGESPNVFTIGPGGGWETEESLKQKFGSLNQKGIVNIITPEQATKLNINPVSINANPSTNPNLTITAESLQKTAPLKSITQNNKNIDETSLTLASTEAIRKQIETQIIANQKLLEPQTGTSAEIDKLMKGLQTDISSIEGRGAAQLVEEEKFNVQAKNQMLVDLNNKMMTKNAELTQAQTEYETLRAEIKSKPYTASYGVGLESNILDKLQARKNSIAADMGLLQAEALAAQNNLISAQNAANRAVDLKYSDMEDRINNQKMLLELYEGEWTKEEKIRADAINMYLKEKETKLQEEKDNAKQEKTVLLNLMADNPGAKISLTDTIEQANAKIVNSPAYKAEVSLKQAQIAKTYNNISGGGGAINLPSNLPNEEQITYKDTINAFNNAVIGLPGAQMEQAQKTFQNYIDSNNIDAAKNYLVNVVVQGMPVDQQNQAIGRTQGIMVLQNIKELIDKAKEKGAETGFFSGNLENLAHKLGQSANQDLAYIGSLMKQQFIIYRRSMTGVAFSPEESKDYKDIFPDITSAETLNTSKVKSVIDTFNINNRAVLGFYMGGNNNYDAVFGKAEPFTLPSDNKISAEITQPLSIETNYLDNFLKNLPVSTPTTSISSNQTQWSGLEGLKSFFGETSSGFNETLKKLGLFK